MACTSNNSLEYLLTQFSVAVAPEALQSEQSAGELVAEFTSRNYRADISTDCFLLCTSGQHLVLGYAGTDYIIINAGPGSVDAWGHDTFELAWRAKGTGYGSNELETGVKRGLDELDADGTLDGGDNRAVESAVTAVAASQVVPAEEPRQGETADMDLGSATGAGSPELQINIADEDTARATPSDFDT